MAIEAGTGSGVVGPIDVSHGASRQGGLGWALLGLVGGGRRCLGQTKNANPGPHRLQRQNKPSPTLASGPAQCLRWAPGRQQAPGQPDLGEFGKRDLSAWPSLGGRVPGFVDSRECPFHAQDEAGSAQRLQLTEGICVPRRPMCSSMDPPGATVKNHPSRTYGSDYPVGFD